MDRAYLLLVSPKSIDVRLLRVVIDIPSLWHIRGTRYFTHQLGGQVIQFCAGDNYTEMGASLSVRKRGRHMSLLA